MKTLISLLIKIFMIFCIMSSFFISPLIAQEEYPTKVITMIYPYVSGGATDLAARALASFLSKSLGQQVIILNKPGGGTTIGGNTVATAKPDGYTLGFFTLNTTIPESYSYFLKPPYTSKDLKPISRIMNSVATIAVKTDAPWKSLRDLIQYAKNNPGMKCSVTSLGATTHITVITIAKTEGLQLTPVVCSGDSEIVISILGGHTPFGLPHYGTVKPQVEAGNIRLLATNVKFGPLAGVPDLEDLGYKLPYQSYHGIFAPKGTPDMIVNKIDKAIEKVKDDPMFVEKINNLNMVITYENAESFGKSILQYKANIEVLFKELGYVKQ